MNKLFFLLLVGGLVASYVLLTQPIPEGTSMPPRAEAPTVETIAEPISTPVEAPAADATTEPVPAQPTEAAIEFAPVAPPDSTNQAVNDEPAPIEPSTNDTTPMPTIELPVTETETLQPLPANSATPDTTPIDLAPVQAPADVMPAPPSMQGYAPIEPVLQTTAEETTEAVFRDPNDLYDPSLAPEQALPTPLPTE